MSDLKRNIFKGALTGLLIIIIFSLQSVVGPHFALGDISGDVIPYMVAFCTLFFGTEWGVGFGFFAGLLADASSPKTFGFYTVMFMLAALMIGIICEKYYKARFITGILMGIACYVTVNFMRLFFHFIIFGNASFSILFTRILPSALYSAVYAIPLYFIISRLYRRLEE